MPRPRTFRNVVVYPTQQLLKPPFMLFRGGPDWPQFWLQRFPRHCRFTPAIPLDIRPRRAATRVVQRQSQGVWCGPLTPHFGHAVTTFGSRLATASLLPTDVPLLFSARAGEEPPGFFWQILARFGVLPERVRIVSSPVIVDTLSVLPQAERLFGGAPSAAYLDLLDQLGGAPPRRDGSKFYVSRAGMWKGKIAGESYLEMALERCGYKAFRPEDFPLDEQLDTYRRASHLVFAEGSAIHGLQLLGRIGAEVTVIARRPGARLAESALSARVASLRYVDAVRGLLHGVGGSGRRQPSAGMTIVDTAVLVAKLEDGGIPIGSRWIEAEFQQHQSRDLKVWYDSRTRNPTHRHDQAHIERSILKLDLKILADLHPFFSFSK